MYIFSLIDRLPLGYSEGLYNGAKYGITKEEFNDGKSFKIYARQLKGADFVSLNYYRTERKDLLKPCEMSEKKVIDFLEAVQPMAK